MLLDSYQDIILPPDSLDDECKELRAIMTAIHNCLHQSHCCDVDCIKMKRELNKAMLAWWGTLRPNRKPDARGMVI